MQRQQFPTILRVSGGHSMADKETAAVELLRKNCKHSSVDEGRITKLTQFGSCRKCNMLMRRFWFTENVHNPFWSPWEEAT